MKEELLPKIDPPPGTFLVGFARCLAAFAAVYVAQYFLFSTPNYHRIGFPFWFWTHHGD